MPLGDEAMIYLAPVLAATFGVILLVWPERTARYFQSQWKADRLAFNRRLADPAKLQQQAKTFRLVGALAILMAAVMVALLWASRT